MLTLHLSFGRLCSMVLLVIAVLGVGCDHPISPENIVSRLGSPLTAHRSSWSSALGRS